MLAYIKGKIIDRRAGYLIVENAGLGYKVWINTDLSARLINETTVELWLYHQVKEDDQALYGFSTPDELNFFELLISVSGVGPKSALNILASARIADLKASIATGDHLPLTRVSGIGKKTAERLVIELRGKVDYLATAADFGDSTITEDLEALVALGYSPNQAREALKKIDRSASPQSRLKEALKYL